MQKYRVTCLILAGETSDAEDTRVFATRRKFETREFAENYAKTVAKSRKPMVGYCDLHTSYSDGHWTVYDPDEYDGPGGEISMTEGDRFAELQAVWEFCELFDRCTVKYNGVPCGGRPGSVEDSGGSGYKRCDRCGML